MRQFGSPLLPWLLMAILGAVVAGVPADCAGQSPVPVPDTPLPDQKEEYLLGIGDIIEVHVWKEADLSQVARVRLDGRISLPLIGEVQAAGNSPQALATLIEARLRKIIAEPSVAVLLNESNRHYYVIGMVKQPGEFPLDTHLTILQALARSGGFLEWAKTTDILVLRHTEEGEKCLTFDYKAVENGKDPGQGLLLAPGDTIIVP